MRIGLLGGSFDPVHYGHLLLAEHCREQCRLDEVWFLPAACSPHKQDHEAAPAAARVDMLELAIGGYEVFSVCRLEVQRGGVSYTVDTLAALNEQAPGAEWFFLMGADALVDFPAWREPKRICELASLVTVRRPGTREPDFAALEGVIDAAPLETMRGAVVDMPLIDLSSSEIRRRVAAGRGIRFQTPRAVEKYIETHALYAG